MKGSAINNSYLIETHTSDELLVLKPSSAKKEIGSKREQACCEHMHATRDKPNPISNYPNSTTNQISKHPARARLAKKRECPSNEPVLAANRKASGIRTRIQHRPNPPKRIKSRAATGEGGECGECSPWSRTGEWAAAEVRWSPTNHSVCPPSASVSVRQLSSRLRFFCSSRFAGGFGVGPHASVGTCHHVR
jgi:hypothetical protein